jgi:hypothetical protein
MKIVPPLQDVVEGTIVKVNPFYDYETYHRVGRDSENEHACIEMDAKKYFEGEHDVKAIKYGTWMILHAGRGGRIWTHRDAVLVKGVDYE